MSNLSPATHIAAEMTIKRLNREIFALRSSLEELEKRPLTRFAHRSTTEMLALIGAGVAFVSMMANRGTANCIILPVAIALLAVFFTLSARRTNQAKSLQKAEMQKVQEPLDAKRAQLQAQRRIIES